MAGGRGNRRTADDAALPDQDEAQRLLILEQEETQRRRLIVPLRMSNCINDEIEIENFNQLTSSEPMEDSDLKYLNLQLLKIKYKKNMGQLQTRYKYGQKNQQTNNISYERLFTCRVVNSRDPSESNRVVYMIQKSKGANSGFLEEDGTYKNHKFTIGCFFRVPDIEPVTEYFGENAVIVSNTQAHICQFPEEVASVPIDPSPIADVMYAFTANNCNLQFLSLTPLETTCGGKNCDKQDPQNCACYVAAESYKPNMILQVKLKITSPEFANVQELREKGLILTFSSRQLMLNFITAAFPDKMNIRSLKSSAHWMAIRNAVKNVIAHVNSDAKKWTIYGWYRNASVQDNAVGDGGEAVNRTASANTIYHVSHIHPGDRDFLDTTKEKGQAMQAFKFDVSSITSF